MRRFGRLSRMTGLFSFQHCDFFLELSDLFDQQTDRLLVTRGHILTKTGSRTQHKKGHDTPGSQHSRTLPLAVTLIEF